VWHDCLINKTHHNSKGDTTMIVLTNAHGRYEVDAEVLSRAIFAVGSASIDWLRQEAAGACGYEANRITGLHDALDDCSRAEVLIAWIESGNHTF
jgi:hypothetical protein